MMFRLRRVNASLRRLFHVGVVNRDQVMEQLQLCSAEDHVLDVVGKNKAKITVDHVKCAVGMLWEFQKERPEMLRSVDLIKSHPQFLTLRVLAENKIALMDDLFLVNMLYILLRLNVEPYDSLVQQLVSEAWRRIDRLPMASLSKFSNCLCDQHLYHSTLMGRITSIVDEKLSTIDDPRILTTLMIGVSSLASPRLRDALISRADHLLDTSDPSNYNIPRRMVQFLRNIKYNYRPLLEKCNGILLHNITAMSAENLCMVLGLYHSLQFDNCDFKLAAKQKLIELIDTSTDAYNFTKAFIALAPLATPEITERLENTALLLADDFNAQQALAVAEALEEIQSRSLSLMNKIASIIQKNLHVYKPVEVARITQAFFLLRYQNPKFFNTLRNRLVKLLQRSVFPNEVTTLTRVLSMLPCSRVEEAVISRLDAVVTQCNLSELSTISSTLAKWVENSQYHYSTRSKYVSLLQTLNRCGRERLRTVDRLDALLDELRSASGEWFEEMLLDETMTAMQKMSDQINWTNVPELAFYLTKINHLCPPLMDKIASVAVEHIDKIHYSATYGTLLPFSVLNYDPPQVDELYDVCIKHFTPHIGSFNPHLLVFLAHALAVADHFPEELIKEIFSINFLRKLDSQLAILNDTLNMRIRERLMELNRAVCLECPEFQVPWFHQRYFQQLRRKRRGFVSPVHQQIHKMLGEVLGGINCVQMGVVTPYCYVIDFECKLDKNLQPLSYMEPSILQVSDGGKVRWDTSSLERIRDELPPGAQRVAVDLLDSKYFCKNSHRMKGKTMMRNRHLEILGYRVVQIPHFEWNSMELSTPDAWKEYLKKKIFG